MIVGIAYVAVGNDNPYIEPAHLLTALLNQDDGGARSLLQRAGVKVEALANGLKSSLQRLPKVSGTGGEVQVSRELMAVLKLADKESQKRGDQFLSSEMVLLALTDDKSDPGKRAREQACRAKRWKPPFTQCAAARASNRPTPRASAKRSKNIRWTLPSAPAWASSTR